MAKEKRFPSDANKIVPKPAAVIKAPEGKAQDLVQVQYKKENHHVIQGVHALRNGVNHLPRQIWDQAKESPAMKQLIKDGHVVGPEDPIQEEVS